MNASRTQCKRVVNIFVCHRVQTNKQTRRTYEALASGQTTSTSSEQTRVNAKSSPVLTTPSKLSAGCDGFCKPSTIIQQKKKGVTDNDSAQRHQA